MNDHDFQLIIPFHPVSLSQSDVCEGRMKQRINLFVSSIMFVFVAHTLLPLLSIFSFQIYIKKSLIAI